MDKDDKEIFLDKYHKCEYCKYGKSASYSCMDCVGDHKDWVPNNDFRQFLAKQGYKLSPIEGRKTIIILAFPACGKTYLKERFKGTEVKVIDSDSSEFSKEDFPNNYIHHIESQIGRYDIILISTHKDVRDAIYNNEYIMSSAAVYICYPSLKIKNDWIERLRKRGNNEKFCKLIEDNYENWITEIQTENRFYPLVLGHRLDFLSHHLYETCLDTDKRSLLYK